MITPTASKYTSRTSAGTTAGATVTSRLLPYAAAVPRAMRLFMSAPRWASVNQPAR
jgi:hypothetical protein